MPQPLLESLPALPVDPVFALNTQLKADPRERKLDLIIGVYKDGNGETPVFEAVHKAEQRINLERESKTYRGLSGNEAFDRLIPHLVLSNHDAIERATVIQSVGGTGALRLLGDFIKVANPDATIWISNPGWGNHEPLFKAAGLKIAKYTYLTPDGAADGEGILTQLQAAKPGDAVLIHGCCHNPSGADLYIDTWQALGKLVVEKGLLPLVDLAYQGLGDGLRQDVAGLDRFVEIVPELLISVSCSKNFGLYCERTGAAIVISASADAKPSITATLQSLARTNYSMPPDHGAAIVAEILADPELRAEWEDELNAMRDRIHGVRTALADAFLESTPDPALQAVRHHKGMFSVLPLSAAQMTRLRDEFGIYGTNAGRVNIAGVSINDVPYLAESVLAVMDEE
ncbi:MAG: amino acid aminotransferase [Thermomicrobiales bacterium]